MLFSIHIDPRVTAMQPDGRFGSKMDIVEPAPDGVVWWTLFNAGGWSVFASAMKKNHYRSILLIIFIIINEPIIISTRAVQHEDEHFIIRSWSMFEHRNFAHEYFINPHWSGFEHHSFAHHRHWLLLNIATTSIKVHWSLLNAMFPLVKKHWSAWWIFVW